SAVRNVRKGRDRRLDGAGIVQTDRAQLNPQRRRRLDGGELTDAGGNGGIPQHHRARDARCDFLEQFEPFRGDRVFERGEPGGIAARPRQAIDQASADWVDHATEHDRYCAGRLLHCGHVEAGISNDDVRRECDQFRGVFAGSVDIASGPADVEARVAAGGPAQFRQLLHDRGELSLALPIALARRQEHADAAHALWLLRSRRKRPRCRRAAKQRDELAPPHHSITSSARASTVGGTLRPSAFAVLRLTTVSYLVGCCTVGSAGFATLSVRWTYAAA